MEVTRLSPHRWHFLISQWHVRWCLKVTLCVNDNISHVDNLWESIIVWTVKITWTIYWFCLHLLVILIHIPLYGYENPRRTKWKGHTRAREFYHSNDSSKAGSWSNGVQVVIWVRSTYTILEVISPSVKYTSFSNYSPAITRSAPCSQ